VHLAHNREIFTGKTLDEDTRYLGPATKINTTIPKGGNVAQWVYRCGDVEGPTQYVYIKDGLVRRVQTEGETVSSSCYPQATPSQSLSECSP